MVHVSFEQGVCVLPLVGEGEGGEGDNGPTVTSTTVSTAGSGSYPLATVSGGS